jgi:hypothetical protein
VTGISDTGVIVGTYYRNGHYHGFMWSSGVYTTIDYPQAENTLLGQIGANGWFVGSYETHQGKTFGFLAVPTGASMQAESEGKSATRGQRFVARCAGRVPARGTGDARAGCL